MWDPLTPWYPQYYFSCFWLDKLNTAHMKDAPSNWCNSWRLRHCTWHSYFCDQLCYVLHCDCGTRLLRQTLLQSSRVLQFFRTHGDWRLWDLHSGSVGCIWKVYWCSLIVVACNWSTLKATIRGFLFWKFVCIHQFVVLFACAFATHAHSEDVIPFLGLKTHQRTTHSNTSHKTSQSSRIFLQSFDMFEVWTAVCTAWSTFFLAEGIFSRTLCDSHLLVESEIGYKTIQNSLWILQNYKYTKLYWPAIGHSEECVQQASTSWSQLQLVGAPLMELEPCSLSTGFPFFCLESL